VMRWLTNGLRHLHGLALPTSSALTKARQRLGSKPLELLFALRRGVLAGSGTPGAFAFGLRLVACDGTPPATPGCKFSRHRPDRPGTAPTIRKDIRRTVGPRPPGVTA
jgi:hypothetical protein